MDLKPMAARDILKISATRAKNIAVANSRVNLLKSDAEKMRDLANGMRKVLKAQCDSYRNHVAETFLDCDYAKVKISKRIAKPRKKDFAGGVNKWAVCK